MSNTLIYSPDGTLARTLNFSTTLQTRFFEGTVEMDAAEVMVSINGSGFSSEGSLIQWGDGKWIVPNPLYEPDGMLLLEGTNTIEVKAILGNGTTAPSAKATVRLTTDEDVSLIVGSPTNVSVEQNNNSVTIRAEAPESTLGFQGINYYASANAGGGVTGYTRVNVSLVADGVPRQEVDPFATQTVDVPVQVDADGNPTADPMYYRLTGQQEDEDEAVLVADYDERYEVPETARTIRLTMSLDQVRDVVSYNFTHNRGSIAYVHTANSPGERVRQPGLCTPALLHRHGSLLRHHLQH